MATESENIVMLLKVAAAAIELDDLERRRRVDQQALSESCRAWRQAKGLVHFVDRDSPEWTQLQNATAGEAGVLQDTKRQVANARKRLRTAVNTWRKHGTAPTEADRAGASA